MTVDSIFIPTAVVVLRISTFGTDPICAELHRRDFIICAAVHAAVCLYIGVNNKRKQKKKTKKAMEKKNSFQLIWKSRNQFPKRISNVDSGSGSGVAVTINVTL